MQQISDLERMFYDDVRAKKRTASGVHSKKGKNGFVGTMRFPSDYMSRAEKMRYKRGSKIMISNMYDTIMPIEEFENLETYEKKNRLSYWRNNNTNKEILKGMGISNGRYYELIAELDLPKAPRTTKAERKKKEVPVANSDEKANSGEIKKIETDADIQQMIVDGLNLSFVGTCKSEQIQKQLKKFSALVEDESDDFYFEVRLMQKQSK